MPASMPAARPRPRSRKAGATCGCICPAVLVRARYRACAYLPADPASAAPYSWSRLRYPLQRRDTSVHTFAGHWDSVVACALTPDGKRLIGAVLVGDAAEYATLQPLAANGLPLPADPQGLILPAADGKAKAGLGAGALPDAAVICSCNGVSKGRICAAVGEGHTSLGAIKSCTQAGSGAPPLVATWTLSNRPALALGCRSSAAGLSIRRCSMPSPTAAANSPRTPSIPAPSWTDWATSNAGSTRRCPAEAGRA